jgi:bifunctional UDP-N-acetylglucosamine pyrophosphorylase/glucosamine-1-phosphate N-acetyltransferase
LASLHEKPAEGTYPVPVQVNIGVYKLNSHVFDYDIPLSPRGEYEITDYISHLARDYPVQLVPCDFWFPIGTPEDLKTAQKIDLGALMLAG